MDHFVRPEPPQRCRLQWFTTSVQVLVLLCAPLGVRSAASTDQHSVETIAQAIDSPIPSAAIAEARQFDDQLMQSGTYGQQKVYLVTDARTDRVKGLVNRLLAAMGEKSDDWVVRVLDSTPKIANAFVAGGKYIYVFTGLVDSAQSDDELAFVVGHELGHSILKHAIRRNQDVSNTLAQLATIVAAVSHGSTSNNAMLMAQSLHNSYSQVDEREADAFGVLATARAGLNPLRGADFFTRMRQAKNTVRAERDAKLSTWAQTVSQLQTSCQTLTLQWNGGQIPQSDQNASAINERCKVAREQAAALSQAQLQVTLEDSNERLASLTSDHPDHQERIASIAALTDYVKGARPLESLSAHQQAQRVIVALMQTHSVLLEPAKAPSAEPAGSGARSANADDLAAKLQHLKEMLQQGLIDQQDYDRKKQELLNQL